jgi:response regulator RpfG family c-di-GMP phosphodiesterase
VMENKEQETAKILFVDDEENVLRALKRIFMDEDIEVVTACSGQSGLEIIKDTEFAVIVSDQKMPEMSGSEFLEKTREVSPDSMRIVLTGYADIGATINAINRGGAYRYITKPWNDTDLVLTVKDAAEKYRLIKENRYLTELTRKQNDELKKWNTELEIMVQEQTIDIQKRNRTLQELNDHLKRNFKNSIEAFSNLIDMRDKSVSNHSKNVAALSRRTAVAMSLPEQEVDNITVSALLHDIGKISIPDSILLKKEDDLTDYEIREYRLHSVRGQVTVDTIEGFQEIGILIRHHHENVDGSGYVDGLKKNDIPVGSRIIALADAVDRVVNNKFLLVANTYKTALDEIERGLDKRYDRDIFTFLQQVILEKIRTSEDQDYSKEAEIHPDRLVPGMVLSRDIRSGTGLLILAQGIVLDFKIIAAIRRYYEIDAPRTGIFVISTKEMSHK